MWKWAGLLYIVYEEAVPAQIPPQVCCRPGLWLTFQGTGKVPGSGP